MRGLASSAFARHYLRNHGCFLFLWVLRCFTSPRSLQPPYVFRWRSPDITPVFRGFPIRRSPDRSSFTSSPGLIAGYNVLHRLLVPRHPPIALSSLLFTTKMLASTVKFSRNGRAQNPDGSPSGSLVRRRAAIKDSRPFRTQQRAWARLAAPMFHSPKGCTDDVLSDSSLMVNVPLKCLLTPRTFVSEGERWTG
jgi:hypothetical protein